MNGVRFRLPLFVVLLCVRDITEAKQPFFLLKHLPRKKQIQTRTTKPHNAWKKLRRVTLPTSDEKKDQILGREKNDHIFGHLS